MLDIARRPCGGEILRGPMGKEGTPGPIKKNKSSPEAIYWTHSSKDSHSEESLLK